MTDVLSRSVPFEIRDSAADNGDGLTLDGYGAVFDTPARIQSWEGTFDEVIARGAFKKTLGERMPVLQFDHGQHPLVGSLPLGSFESLSEDEHGLHVVARLHDNWLVQPVRDAIRSQAVSGMSFRFQVVKDEWRNTAGKQLTHDEAERHMQRNGDDILARTITEVRLFEVGPVVFPAYAETSVGVRSKEIVSFLSDPQARAELARALVGTPSEPSDAEGASGDERAASSDVEPTAVTPVKPVPSPAARDRALRLERGN
jgi:HK97 family phage prohead protease